MKKYLFVVLLILLIGCSSQEQEIAEEVIEEVSEEPEVKEEVVIEKQETKLTSISDLIGETPDGYWFAFEDEPETRVYVANNKRALQPYALKKHNVFWDTETKELYLFIDEVSEVKWNKLIGVEGGSSRNYLPAFFKFELTGNKVFDNGIMTKELTKHAPLTKYYELGAGRSASDLVSNFYLKGPKEWMEEYKGRIPFREETSPRIIKVEDRSMSNRLSLHFDRIDSPGNTIIFRFDETYNMPFIIELYKGEDALVEKITFIYDVVYAADFRNNKITEELIGLPDNSIIVTMDQWEELVD